MVADLLALTAARADRAVLPGEVLMTEGDSSTALLVVVEGAFEVRKGEAVLAVVDQPGACLGELSVLLGQPHHATVVARSAGRVRDVEDGAAFLHAEPGAALLVARILAHRLDVVNSYLGDLRAQYADTGGHLGLVHQVLADLAAQPHRAVELGSEREPDPRY